MSRADSRLMREKASTRTCGLFSGSSRPTNRMYLRGSSPSRSSVSVPSYPGSSTPYGTTPMRRPYRRSKISATAWLSVNASSAHRGAVRSAKRRYALASAGHLRRSESRPLSTLVTLEPPIDDVGTAVHDDLVAALGEARCELLDGGLK